MKHHLSSHKISDGKWGAWRVWRACSAKCGGGTQIRSRKCNKPAPDNGGIDCHGAKTDKRICGIKPCPVGKIFLHKLLSTYVYNII